MGMCARLMMLPLEPCGAPATVYERSSASMTARQNHLRAHLPGALPHQLLMCALCCCLLHLMLLHS